MELNIDNLKLQLNIEIDDTKDDTLLQNYLDTAIIAVTNYLDNGIDYVIPSGSTINAAIILLAAHYYSNRNMVTMASAGDMPYTFQFLLNYYKNYALN